MKHIIFISSLSTLFVIGLFFATTLIAADTRPNIIFIMSDDHGAGAISCYGSQLIQTPGIDRLAREGMRFDNCFVPASLCTPSRAAMLTGRYPHNNGVQKIGQRLDTTLSTYPKILQGAGYQTAIVGKWHLTTQPQGFDFYSILRDQGRYWDCPFLESGRPWLNAANTQASAEDPRQAIAPNTPVAPMVIHPGYVSDVITDTSIAWLEKRDKNKPFCLLVHHKAPHAPHQYPERFEQLFTEDIPYPATFTDDWATRDTLRLAQANFSKFTIINGGDIQGNELGKKPIMDRSDPVAFRQWSYQVFMKGYLRLIVAMDENIARLLDYLDEAGLAENTLVVYTTDNGFFLGDHGLYNKMWMYEESLRIPFIVRFPGKVSRETVCSQMISSLDFAPTFAALASVEQPKEFQGNSLLPLFENAQTLSWTRKSHYYHYHDQFGVPSHCGIRTATYKALCFYEQAGGPVWELFDLTADPNELVNIAGQPQYEELLTSMQQLLFDEMKANGDPVIAKILASPAPEQQETIVLQKEDKPLARYRLAPVSFKPYIDELRTPSGKSILRDAPADHVHHHALMYAIRVGGCNFWEETNANFGKQVAVQTQHTSNSVDSMLDWNTPAQKTLLKEFRRINVKQENDATLLDWQSTFQAVVDTVLGEEGIGHYNGLGLRFLQEMDKGGRFFSDTGTSGSENVRGSERLTLCRWMAYTAKLEGEPVTVAIFDHPSNPVPMTAFTMGGTSGPFAYLSATMNLHRKPVELKADQLFLIRYRIAVWDGEQSHETVDNAYQIWKGIK